MKSDFCKCPYIPCKLRGNCRACVVKSIDEGTLTHCMEEIAMDHGAQLPLRLPNTVIWDDFEQMSLYCAQLIIKVLEKKPDALLCLPAGESALGTFKALKKMRDQNKVDFSQAWFVSLDEWLNLKDESENCQAFMFKNFYNPLNIDKNRIKLFDTHSQDMDGQCLTVDQFIFDHGGIDFMLLGLGMNGHVGLNEPHESFDSYTKVVKLDSVTKNIGQKYFSEDMELTEGITLGMKHIFEAEQVVLQVSGRKKAEIVKAIYTSQPSYALPATVMKLLSNAEVVLDTAAATLVKELLEN